MEEATDSLEWNRQVPKSPQWVLACGGGAHVSSKWLAKSTSRHQCPCWEAHIWQDIAGLLSPPKTTVSDIRDHCGFPMQLAEHVQCGTEKPSCRACSTESGGLDLKEGWHKSEVVVHALNPRTGRQLWVWGQPGIQSEIQDSQSYVQRLYVKTTTIKPTKQKL